VIDEFVEQSVYTAEDIPQFYLRFLPDGTHTHDGTRDLSRYVGCHTLGPALGRSSIMVLAPPPRELPTHTGPAALT
jgi:hypothetical protein